MRLYHARSQRKQGKKKAAKRTRLSHRLRFSKIPTPHNNNFLPISQLLFVGASHLREIFSAFTSKDNKIQKLGINRAFASKDKEIQFRGEQRNG